MSEKETAYPPLPPDDVHRTLRLAQQDNDGKLIHIGMVGDTYTILVAGADTNERFCVIDMHVPPGGGPGPHRHDFEETFILLDGEIEVTFRGNKYRARAGETVNIPANAPHQFHNGSFRTARMICICSPAGNERFFMELGVPVATRTAPPPEMNEQERGEFLKKAIALAPKYRTELLKEA
jgi:quercetin dioxygenase-like cupin family protein